MKESQVKVATTTKPTKHVSSALNTAATTENKPASSQQENFAADINQLLTQADAGVSVSRTLKHDGFQSCQIGGYPFNTATSMHDQKNFLNSSMQQQSGRQMLESRTVSDQDLQSHQASLTDNTKSLFPFAGKRWFTGVQIVHQKEISMHEADEEDKTYSETSLSLLNTPDVSRMSERAMFGNKIGQRATTPIKIPSGSLLRIDEREGEDQEDDLKVDSDDSSPVKWSAKKLLAATEESPEREGRDTNRSFKEQQMTKSEKQKKSKRLKKIMKERLNIDCLRMLCEESPTGSPTNANRNLAVQNSSNNLNDSFHVLMREIGIEQNTTSGLSAAFLQKNGEAQREKLNSFTGMFSVRDLLGVGAFGVVLLVKNRFTKEKSALKIIAKDNLSKRAQAILKNESTIMRTMNHPSVVSLKRIFENQKFIILEMELIPGGQLKRLFKLKDEKGEPKLLSDLEASKVMKSLLEGVAYVHARDIVHRDLKPENILLVTEDEVCHDVKIVDFGLSAEQNWRQRQIERAGTLIYMAPEQVTKKGYSKKVDLWACGIIGYQLLTAGQHPCYSKGMDYGRMLENAHTKPIQWKFSENFSLLAKDFFLNLCTTQPSLRYDAVTALQHPWITRKSEDEIPLNMQQEFAMFKQESQLRKVIRLVYFASQVKMCQKSGPQGGGSLHLPRRNQVKVKPGEPLKNKLNVEAKQLQLKTQSSNLSHVLTIEDGTDAVSYSPSSRFKNLLTKGKKSSQASETTTSYTHNAFLSKSFAAYKEFLLDQKNSIDSTSADSRLQQQSSSAGNNTGSAAAHKDQSLTQRKDDCWNNSTTAENLTQSLSRKSPMKKQRSKIKSFNKKNGLVGTLSPIAAMTNSVHETNMDTSFSGHQKVVQSFQDKKNKSAIKDTAPTPFTIGRDPKINLPKTTSSDALLTTIGDSTAGDKSKFQSSPEKAAAMAQNNYFKPVDFTQGRSGRNLVSMKTPDITSQTIEKTSSNRTASEQRSELGQIRPTTTGTTTKSSQLNNFIKCVDKRHENRTTELVDESSLRKKQFQSFNLSKVPMSVLQNNYQGSLSDEQRHENDSKIVFDQNSGDENFFHQDDRPLKRAPLVKQSNIHLTQSEQKTLKSVLQQVIPVMSAELSDNATPSMMSSSVQESNQNTQGVADRRFGRKFKMQQKLSPRQELGAAGSLEREPGFLSQPTDSTFNDSVLAKQTKSVKKRTKQRHPARGLNTRSLSKHTTFDAVTHSQHSYKKGGHSKLQQSIEESKIDWFQMIQAEKTVGGSKILQEHLLNRGSPIYEHMDESMRSSMNGPGILNSDYFMKQSDSLGHHQSFQNKKSGGTQSYRPMTGNLQIQNRSLKQPQVFLSKKHTVPQDNYPAGNHYYAKEEGSGSIYNLSQPSKNNRWQQMQSMKSANSNTSSQLTSAEVTQSAKRNGGRTKKYKTSYKKGQLQPAQPQEGSDYQAQLNLHAQKLFNDSIPDYNPSTAVKDTSMIKVLKNYPGQAIDKSDFLENEQVDEYGSQKQLFCDLPVLKKTQFEELLSPIPDTEPMGSGLTANGAISRILKSHQSPANKKCLEDRSVSSLQTKSIPKSLHDRRRPVQKKSVVASGSQDNVTIGAAAPKKRSSSPFFSGQMSGGQMSTDSIILQRGLVNKMAVYKTNQSSLTDLHRPSLIKESDMGCLIKIGGSKKESKTKRGNKAKNKNPQVLAAVGKQTIPANPATNKSTLSGVGKPEEVVAGSQQLPPDWNNQLNNSQKFGLISNAAAQISGSVSVEPVGQYQFNAPVRKGNSYQHLFKYQQQQPRAGDDTHKSRHKKKTITENMVEASLITEEAQDEEYRKHGNQSVNKPQRQTGVNLMTVLPQSSSSQIRRNQVFEQHRVTSQAGAQSGVSKQTARPLKKVSNFAICGTQFGTSQTNNTIERQ